MIGDWLNKPETRQSVGYPVALLGGVALLVSAVIGIADALTRADIAQRQLEDLQATLQQVVPTAYFDNDLVRDVVVVRDGERALRVYRARRDGEVRAVSFQVSEPGYGNTAMRIVLGIDRAGELLGVRVVSHSETPGLGDKIEIQRSDWIRSFDGRSLTDPPPAGWAVKKDGGVFDQFTGATITPRAVVNAVRGGLEFFVAHRAELLDESPTQPSPREEVGMRESQP